MNLRNKIAEILIKNNGLKTVLLLCGINFLYYFASAVFFMIMLQKIEDGPSMLFWAIAFVRIEWIITVIGYFALFLKLRVGQILLVLFYVIKVYTYITAWIRGRDMEIRFVIEMLFFLVLVVAMIFSKNVNIYIKSRKRKTWKEKVAFMKEKVKR